MTDEQAARLRELAGWTVEQRDGRVIVQKPYVGAYAACETDVSNIASAILAAFALDVSDALDEARRQSMDARNVLEAHKRVASEWHRRMQQAEAACAAAYEGKPRSGGKSVGRSLANMAAMHYRGERDAAMALLRECREFIDTTRDPAYPAGADLADRIDALLGGGEG